MFIPGDLINRYIKVKNAMNNAICGWKFASFDEE